MPDSNSQECTFTIPISFSRFPQSHEKLASLGFDEIYSSGSCLRLQKHAGGRLMPGKGLFFRIEITRGSAKLSYAVPPGADPSSRRLKSAAMLLHVLLLFDGAKADAKGLAKLLQQPLDEADWLLSMGLESFSRRQKELSSEAAKLRSSNKRLFRELEKANLIAMEKERRIASLSARIAKLESVSDQVLGEMVLEWLRSHSGRFDSAEFSKANRVPAPRAEEGLESLLASGAIREIGGVLAHDRGSAKRSFEEKFPLFRQLSSLASFLGKKP
jgi:hypothetical protein